MLSDGGKKKGTGASHESFLIFRGFGPLTGSTASSSQLSDDDI